MTFVRKICTYNVDEIDTYTREIGEKKMLMKSTSWRHLKTTPLQEKKKLPN